MRACEPAAYRNHPTRSKIFCTIFKKLLDIELVFDHSGVMGASGDLTTITDSVRDLHLGADMSGRAAFDAMTALVTLRNLIDHHAATVVGHLDRLGSAD